MGYIDKRQSPHTPPRTPPPPANDGDDNLGQIIAAVVVVSVLFILFVAIYLLRHLRVRGHSPKYIPTAWLKNKWRAWNPSSSKKKPATPLEAGAAMTDAPASGLHPDDRVDRHTSVRSIMTLPAYTIMPRATEQLIGREGERGGIDTVVEFPETVDEEEARRDEEMESLYQIRAARRVQEAERRAQRAARDERRRLRQEARARGDHAALEELRAQSLRDRTAATGQTAPAGRQTPATMIADHNARMNFKERGRKVSSVAYAALGVARHDGSRMRSDSASSDNRPLLESAASMAGGAGGSFTPFHDRNASSSSLSRFVTIDGQPDGGADEVGRSRSGSHAGSSFEILPSPLRGQSIDLMRDRGLSSSAMSRPRQDSSPATPTIGERPPEYENLISSSQRSRNRSGSSPLMSHNEQDEDAPPYEPPSTTRTGHTALDTTNITNSDSIEASPATADFSISPVTPTTTTSTTKQPSPQLLPAQVPSIQVTPFTPPLNPTEFHDQPLARAPHTPSQSEGGSGS